VKGGLPRRGSRRGGGKEKSLEAKKGPRFWEQRKNWEKDERGQTDIPRNGVVHSSTAKRERRKKMWGKRYHRPGRRKTGFCTLGHSGKHLTKRGEGAKEGKGGGGLEKKSSGRTFTCQKHPRNERVEKMLENLALSKLQMELWKKRRVLVEENDLQKAKGFLVQDRRRCQKIKAKKILGEPKGKPTKKKGHVSPKKRSHQRAKNAGGSGAGVGPYLRQKNMYKEGGKLNRGLGGEKEAERKKKRKVRLRASMATTASRGRTQREPSTKFNDPNPQALTGIKPPIKKRKSGRENKGSVKKKKTKGIMAGAKGENRKAYPL